MARFTMIAVIAALLCLSGISASRGGSRGLLASTTCTVSTSAKSWSINQITCKGAYEEAFAATWKYFCENPNAPVPAIVTETVYAKAVAIANAVATSSAKVSMTGSISPSCETGSYSYFDAIVRAKAMARSVAQSYASASATVMGESAFAAVSSNIQAISNALATTCETKYLSIFRFHKCAKTTCSTSSCGLSCKYDDVSFVTATAEAVAVAIAEGEAVVETYYNTEACDADCEIALCGFVCPDGC